ncbi:MAG: glutathione S-transferase family protein [Gammaproteobacteria bacterium]|nr:glutathione S-transferase family protein [Gammaproteobacteria bacterium]
MTRIKIYGDSISGNCYKLKLAAAQLDIEHEWHEMDILAGKTHTPEFLALNPNGKVPLLVLDDGRCLPESNAILWYLADGSPLVGVDRFERATVLAWMCFEQYSHEPYIATSRFIIQYLGSPPERQAELDGKKAGGYSALNIMEEHLSKHEFFANDAYSIADIALFAYTQVAHEGGFDLSAYPEINKWLDRVRDTDGFVAMTD